MQELGQRLPTKRISGSKPWWVCMIATLSFCLWSLNLIPILRVEYQLITNLAISQHRIPLLQRLSSQPNIGIAGRSTPFTSLEILPKDINPTASTISELVSVRVKIRIPIRKNVNELERFLDELTTPTSESDECQVYATQLLKERWRLESSNHLMKRLELDRERDLNAIETEKIAEDPIDTPIASTPFRLTAYGTREQRPHSQSLLQDNLRDIIQARTENVDAMTLTLEKLKAQSKGFLSLTGSPSLIPLVRPLSMFRFAILCILALFVWLLLFGWIHPIEGYASVLKRSSSSIQRNQDISNAFPKSEATPQGVNKTMAWMLREGIPYLGTIQVQMDQILEEPASSKSNPRFPSVTRVAASPDVTSSISTWPCQIDATQLLRKLGEGSLVLWIGLFAARLFFDPSFRELVSVAPLAAVSRMIFGIR